MRLKLKMQIWLHLQTLSLCIAMGSTESRQLQRHLDVRVQTSLLLQHRYLPYSHVRSKAEKKAASH